MISPVLSLHENPKNLTITLFLAKYYQQKSKVLTLIFFWNSFWILPFLLNIIFISTIMMHTCKQLNSSICYDLQRNLKKIGTISSKVEKTVPNICKMVLKMQYTCSLVHIHQLIQPRYQMFVKYYLIQEHQLQHHKCRGKAEKGCNHCAKSWQVCLKVSNPTNISTTV